MFLSLTLASALLQPAPAPFEFKNGDRIVWIGNTLVEREQRHGYWETALLAANADKPITLRNLGWSGDTVHGEARGRFDFANADKCFMQIVEQTLALKPTVIFISYGTNESFEGEAGLPRFEKGLEKLLDALKPANARIVLFTPMPFDRSPRFPDVERRNVSLRAYAEVVRRVAVRRQLPCADLERTILKHIEKREKFQKAGVLADDDVLTDNGMHLSESGYRETSGAFLQSLGIATELPWCLTGVELTDTQKRLMKNLEPLRMAVIEKNQLFFHRWRPQNETYLFGFRKHEQGRNAKEVAEFDPLVAKAEEKIDELRKSLK